MARSAGSPRNTQQREAIERVIREADGPLTVEQILELAGGAVRGLGIATVYRTIKLLIESEQIQAVILPDGQSRYEPTDRGHHHHFRCRRCHQVYDLDVCPVTLNAEAPLPEGFVVEDHELTLYGVCPACNRP